MNGEVQGENTLISKCTISGQRQQKWRVGPRNLTLREEAKLGGEGCWCRTGRIWGFLMEVSGDFGGGCGIGMCMLKLPLKVL